MIEPKEAMEIILSSAKRLETIEVGVAEAVGYVLDEDVVSPDNIPPFDNSAMDGFALLAADIVGAADESPVTLEIIDDQPAGRVSGKTVVPGTAIKVMTGAPVPGGADTIVPIEHTDYDEKTVHIKKAAPVGRHVRRAGEDISSGSVVLSAGKLLEPVEIGILAAVGRASVKVVRKPRVAVIGTGDELVPLGAPLEPGKIRDSNSYVLYNQALAVGAEVDRLGVAKDELADVRAMFERAMSYDVIITTGGVSVGERDFVREVLEAFGAEEKFWKVAHKPGKPLAFLTLGEKLFFGLPGNPVAALVCFEEYARPALLKMMGREKLFRPLVTAIVAEDIKKKPGRMHYAGAVLEERGDANYVRLNGKQGSGILTSMSGANCIALLPRDAGVIKAGEKLSVQLIGLPEDR